LEPLLEEFRLLVGVYFFNVGILCFVTWLPRLLRGRPVRKMGKTAGKRMVGQQERPEAATEKEVKQ
jgi:hypothetical protein